MNNNKENNKKDISLKIVKINTETLKGNIYCQEKDKEFLNSFFCN